MRLWWGIMGNCSINVGLGLWWGIMGDCTINVGLGLPVQAIRIVEGHADLVWTAETSTSTPTISKQFYRGKLSARACWESLDLTALKVSSPNLAFLTPLFCLPKPPLCIIWCPKKAQPYTLRSFSKHIDILQCNIKPFGSIPHSFSPSQACIELFHVRFSSKYSQTE